jgi:hypothetical protein
MGATIVYCLVVVNSCKNHKVDKDIKKGENDEVLYMNPTYMRISFIKSVSIIV